MILTPQETSIMRGRPHDRIMQSVQRAITLGYTKALAESDGSIVAIVDGEDVPAFTIPMQVRDVIGKEYFCIDLRKANREYILDETGTTFTPKLLSEANFLVNLALSQKVWMYRISDFNPIYWDMGHVYAMWVGMKVGKRLALNPSQQSELICQFAYFYYTQPYSALQLNEMEYNLLLNKICNQLRYNISEVQYILKPFNRKTFASIDEFCEVIANTTDNPKMKKFNRIVVQTLLIGSWFGQNSRELIALASEYPPAFMCLVYRSLNERAYKDTDITQIVLRLFNSNKQKQINLVYADILKRNAQ